MKYRRTPLCLRRLQGVGVAATLLAWIAAPMIAVAAAAAPPGSLDAPDGAPLLAPAAPLAARAGSSGSPEASAADDASALQVREARVQGRLASAQVSVGGRAYLVVDPAAGRYDRQADNGGRRVTPVLWQLFRF